MLQPPLQFHATNNRAEKGAAIYVEDICSLMISNEQQVSQCFLQIPSSRQEQLVKNYAFIFTGNIASVAGNDLYGGMLDTCAMNYKSGGYALDTLQTISTFNESLESNSSSISSDPFSVCFCSNHSLNCGRSTMTFRVQRGQTFIVPLVATGQGNGIIPAVIRAQFKYANLSHTGLAQNQAIQQGEKHCQPLQYTIFSAEDYVELTIFAEGPCRDLGKARRTIQVHLLPCPVGFTLSGGK